VHYPEGKRQLGRPKCRWEDNIKTDLQEVRLGLTLSGPEQEPVTGCYEHGNEAAGSIK
jgi:hypothetical protein